MIQMELSLEYAPVNCSLANPPPEFEGNGSLVLTFENTTQITAIIDAKAYV